MYVMRRMDIVQVVIMIVYATENLAILYQDRHALNARMILFQILLEENA